MEKSKKTALDRINEKIGQELDLLNLMASELNWSDLHTLLLSLYEKKIPFIKSSEILKNHNNNRLTQISDANPIELMRIDMLLYSVLPKVFKPIELSPVSVLGANSVLTPISSKTILSTIRNVEVTGDTGMALAIECARIKDLDRTKKDSINLATSQRLVRLQSSLIEKSLQSHFKSFALASSGIDTGFNMFEIMSISSHIKSWLNFLHLSNSEGFDVHSIDVSLSNLKIIDQLIYLGLIKKDDIRNKKSVNLIEDFNIQLPGCVKHAREIPLDVEIESLVRELEHTEKVLFEPLRKEFPDVNFYFDLSRVSGYRYYNGLCYRLSAKNNKGEVHPLAGGGASDWTQKMLQNKRERLVTGGFGTEMFLKNFI